MGRVGNSLDNREAEYFFGCLKGEYLNHLATAKMKFHEIYKYILEYIEWYNFKRKNKKYWIEKSQLLLALLINKM
ncbi:transposase [Entomoplasma ellychniae]|uniref:Transposase n=1 Tax=Entomoplasma ellychniae TaxID=2114 RepID=A0A8E2QZL1_9MOLU|nr:IS3 family transposase [Entomoplasma ellychniae]PPE05093.1 transposase [Entomoplasma ellychniae]